MYLLSLFFFKDALLDSIIEFKDRVDNVSKVIQKKKKDNVSKGINNIIIEFSYIYNSKYYYLYSSKKNIIIFVKDH